MMPSLLTTLLVLALLGPPPARDVATAGPMALPAISMFAGGNFGPGWWSLDIDETGAFVADRDRSPRRRRLTEPQRGELSGLLSALPRDQPSYRFHGPSYVDVTVEFELTVGRGKDRRRYAINDTFAEYADHPEVTDVLAVMHFLRRLVDSAEAHVPPLIDGLKTK